MDTAVRSRRLLAQVWDRLGTSSADDGPEAATGHGCFEAASTDGDRVWVLLRFPVSGNSREGLLMRIEQAFREDTALTEMDINVSADDAHPGSVSVVIRAQAGRFSDE